MSSQFIPQKPADSRIVGMWISRAASALLLCLGANAALAGPGFIAGSRITKGTYIAEVSVQLNCGVQYLGHEPEERGDQLRIHLESTGICSGVSPLVAKAREQHRPALADEAKLVNLEYDGESSSDSILRFNFSDDVRFAMQPSPDDNTIVVRIYFDPPPGQSLDPDTATGSRLVTNEAQGSDKYLINLQSSRRTPAATDMLDADPGPGLNFLSAQEVIDGTTWHRLQLGYFDSAEAAEQKLETLRAAYPSAWIDRATGNSVAAAVAPTAAEHNVDTIDPTAVVGDDKLATLMEDARKAMIAGEIGRAVQIYTKVLQQPPNEHQQLAQEYLALARERNGQLAHAKAEYQRYLDLYPEGEGADRVRQRYSALVSRGSQGGSTMSVMAEETHIQPQGSDGAWSLRTFVSQFYRLGANQLNDNEAVISQSSLYSDVNVDVRRRGERFDFSTRLTAGYRNDLLDRPTGSGNDLRLSYAYADLADSRFGIRGRLGRQTRNTGGVLGRFDGVNVDYQLNDRIRFDAVGGKPVYSTSNTEDNGRTFYGISSNLRPLGDNLDVGVFYLQQEIWGVSDRQAVGSELRYFAENKSVWGMIDYDTSFGEIGSMFLQGSWRLPSFFTVTGLIDRRRSPFLSTGNAIIGQTSLSFSDLALKLTEDELRQLALDRAPSTTTVTAGLSKSLTPKLQLNLNVSETTIDATPETGGVAATPITNYRYFSTDLVASSLLTEGDVSIFGVRYADSSSTEVWSVSLDTRFPVGRSLRINPRLRVNYRQIKSDSSDEWIYSPGIRFQYRLGKKLRLEFEAGKQYAYRTLEIADLNRESYFINCGYQFFF